MRTREHVLNSERPALETILRKALAMDQKAGLGPVADDALTVEFTDGAQETPLQVAGTLQALRAAEAASDLTIVGMLHPDWTVQQVADEVRLIREGAAARANLDATTATMDLGGTDAGLTG